MDQILESEQKPHTPSSRASYGVSIVIVLEETYRVITHCAVMIYLVPWIATCYKRRCSKPLASFLTTNRLINIYGFLIVILLPLPSLVVFCLEYNYYYNKDTWFYITNWISTFVEISLCFYGPLTRYVKLPIAHAPGMPGTLPRHWLQRKPQVSDSGMHHGTCLTHVSWCMSGLLTRGGGETVPGIPGACATLNFGYLARGPYCGV